MHTGEHLQIKNTYTVSPRGQSDAVMMIACCTGFGFMSFLKAC